jgi:hypothetical protein
MTKTKFIILTGVLLLVMLAGCRNGDQPPAVPPTETETVEMPTEPLKTDQPQPQTPVLRLVILVVPAGTPEDEAQQLEEQTLAVASARGLEYERREEVNLQDAPQNLVMVISAGEPAGLTEMAAALPAVQFVISGESDVIPTPNLTIFGSSGENDLVQAFLAGYIAAVQSDEYRIGIISVGDAAGQYYRDAFLNGVIYFCGTCAPIYPPFEIYPLFAEVPPGVDRAALEDAARTLIGKGVNIMLVAPPLQDEGFYLSLMQNGVRIIGTDAPPAGMESAWVASVVQHSGVSLEEVIGAILDGQVVPEVPGSVEIDFTGIGEARLAHFLEVLERVNSGEIDPLGKVD